LKPSLAKVRARPDKGSTDFSMIGGSDWISASLICSPIWSDDKTLIASLMSRLPVASSSNAIRSASALILTAAPRLLAASFSARPRP
jgi:hypothetical protein